MSLYFQKLNYLFRLLSFDVSRCFFSVWFTTSLVCRVEVMKGLVLLVASLLPISIEALLCRVCSSTLNGNQVSGVCENQGDNGRLVLCREGFHSCYYRFDQTSKYHGIRAMHLKIILHYGFFYRRTSNSSMLISDGRKST